MGKSSSPTSKSYKVPSHKDALNMLSFTKKCGICIEPECKKQACFNFEGEKGVLFCGIHREPSMINVVSKKHISVQVHL